MKNFWKDNKKGSHVINRTSGLLLILNFQFSILNSPFSIINSTIIHLYFIIK